MLSMGYSLQPDHLLTHEWLWWDFGLIGWNDEYWWASTNFKVVEQLTWRRLYARVSMPFAVPHWMLLCSGIASGGLIPHFTWSVLKYSIHWPLHWIYLRCEIQSTNNWAQWTHLNGQCTNSSNYIQRSTQYTVIWECGVILPDSSCCLNGCNLGDHCHNISDI